MTPLVTATIQSSGWRAGFRQLTIVFFLITIPVILLLIKEHPSDVGQKPLGWDHVQAVPAEMGGTISGMTRAQAFRSKTYWCYIAALFLTQVCGMGLQNNIIGYLTDVGFDSMYAASIFSLMMFILVPGKIALGSIYDRFGIRIGSIVITVTLSLSAVLLILSVRSPIPVIFAIVFGFGDTIQTMQLPYMTGKLLGGEGIHPHLRRLSALCQPGQRRRRAPDRSRARHHGLLCPPPLSPLPRWPL